MPQDKTQLVFRGNGKAPICCTNSWMYLLLCY